MVLASAVFDLVGRIAAESTVANVWRAYLGAAEEAGLSHGFACFMPSDGDFSSTTFADAMPDGWSRNYHEQGYAAADPLTSRLLAQTRPVPWTAHDWDHGATPLQQRWRDDNIAAEIHGGLAIPDRSSGILKVISLGGRNDDLHPLDRASLHFAGIEALNRMYELGVRPSERMGPPLSKRERECLKWIAAGKTDWEIGGILSLSEKTVNIYVERAKRKLGVQTRTQAVVHALRNGIIAL
jgi:LuxR family transcriptional regulator, quorum-sensing system regulator BjaR1